jgi:hypothetical protein
MSALQQLFFNTFGSGVAPAPSGNQTFTYTGATQTFTVPAGVTSINVNMWGAGGASNNVSGGASAKGGAGGFVNFTISVTPGESLTVNIGGKGAMPVTQYRQPGAGGGMSALLRGSTYLGIAGGGGGAGGYGNSNDSSWGGSGGGTTADAGGTNPYATAGGGGTQSAGGASGGDGSTPGSSLQGGNGSGSNLNTLGGWPNGGNASTDQERGGGGGGGYYGGGGGGGGGTWGAGGGGGSSYTDLSATSVTHIKSAANDSSAPGTTQAGYVTGVALGGLLTTVPGNGLVYLEWS